ncbi:MAG: hypothetical protein PHY47_12645 [Lachnospiraceae bacterium]|nr:hypothetical protein [Lachnospiraceae bacterium]
MINNLMLDSFAIIGITIALTQIIKEEFVFFKTKKGKLYIPIIIFTVSGIANLLNALVFGENILLMPAFKEGLLYGLYASGTYGVGQTYLNKEKKG